MGFFGNLGDALSGKIYKQNTLVGANVAKLLEKSQSLPDSKFIKHWSLAAILSSDVALNFLLFEKQGDEINNFKKNIEKLNPEKVLVIIKLLVGHYLTAFKRNEGNKTVLKRLNISEKNLEEDVFSTFSFDNDDKRIFEELDKKFDEDAARYFLALHKTIFERAYGMADENDIFSSTMMASIISNAYTNAFLPALKDALKGKLNFKMEK